MKWRVVTIIILLLLLAFPICARADVIDDLEENVEEGLGNIDFSEMDEVASGFVGNFLDKVKSIINGEFDSAESFWQMLGQMFGEGVVELLPQLCAITVVLVILGLIRRTSGGLISESTDSVISFVGVTVVLLAVLTLIVGLYRQVYDVLFQVATLSEASSPILLTLLIANGGNALSSVCQPAMVMFSSVVIAIVRNVVLPLSVFALIFAIVSNISSNVKVGKMSGFLTNAASWTLGIVFMLYSAFTSVQGITAGSLDGVSYRAAKFATKSYVPILGGYLAEGFDVVVASTSLIKNAFGAVTLLVLLFAIVKPLVSILCENIGLQAVAAVCEPIVDDKYVKMLGGISKTLTFLSVLILAVAFMFCIQVLIAITCANGVV